MPLSAIFFQHMLKCIQTVMTMRQFRTASPCFHGCRDQHLMRYRIGKHNDQVRTADFPAKFSVHLIKHLGSASILPAAAVLPAAVPAVIPLFPAAVVIAVFMDPHALSSSAAAAAAANAVALIVFALFFLIL